MIINILKGDCYSALYINGKKIYDSDRHPDVFLLNAIFSELNMPFTISQDSEEDFEWDDIWIDGVGYKGTWDEIEKGRL